MINAYNTLSISKRGLNEQLKERGENTMNAVVIQEVQQPHQTHAKLQTSAQQKKSFQAELESAQSRVPSNAKTAQNIQATTPKVETSKPHVNMQMYNSQVSELNISNQSDKGRRIDVAV